MSTAVEKAAIEYAKTESEHYGITINEDEKLAFVAGAAWLDSQPPETQLSNSESDVCLNILRGFIAMKIPPANAMRIMEHALWMSKVAIKAQADEAEAAAKRAAIFNGEPPQQ